MTDLPTKMLHAMERLRPLCPDHQDKARGYQCLLCEIERRTALLRRCLYECDWHPRDNQLVQAIMAVPGVRDTGD